MREEGKKKPNKINPMIVPACKLEKIYKLYTARWCLKGTHNSPDEEK